MIEKKGNKFFLETYFPETEWKYLGKIIEIHGVKAFVTHLKKPEIHFYFKGKGYPVNEEMLKLLKPINVSVIIIPEESKSGVTTYYASTVKEYLDGGLIIEPQTEKQRYIPLEAMSILPNIKLDLG